MPASDGFDVSDTRLDFKRDGCKFHIRFFFDVMMESKSETASKYGLLIDCNEVSPSGAYRRREIKSDKDLFNCASLPTLLAWHHDLLWAVTSHQ